jgi:Protein of unknown function (DUF2911)
MRRLTLSMLLLAALPLAAQNTTTPAPAAAPAPAPKPPALRLPRPSPNATLMQTAGITDITIKYSRPGVKGRTIWGTLVPYGKVWRTGANDATTIAFSDDVTIGGSKLAAGTYSLHTIPGETAWTIVFNNVSNQWGSFAYDPAKDALRIEAKPEKAEFREWLTFEIPEMSNDMAKIVIRWENIAVPFTVMTNGTEKSMAGIRTALASAAADDWQTPYRAADFAFGSGNTAEATTWLDRSLKAKPTMAGLWLRARMQAKAGDKAAAMKTTDEALALAGPNDKDFAAEITRLRALW